MDSDHDSYKPAQMAALVETAGVAKARMPLGRMVTLAVLAGVFIGLGSAFYLMAITGADPNYGPTRVLGGAVFALGLILVVVGGAELFTGNALMTIAAVDGKITLAELLRNWGVVWLGNLVGAVALAVAFWASGLLNTAFGEMAATVALAKVSGGPLVWLVKGALCNALVCLAVWLSVSARDTTGKIFAILWPVTAFVTLRLEHSVANMFFLPLGLMQGADIRMAGIVGNLVWVSLGNIIGGAGGVALAYRFAFLRGQP